MCSRLMVIKTCSSKPWIIMLSTFVFLGIYGYILPQTIDSLFWTICWAQNAIIESMHMLYKTARSYTEFLIGSSTYHTRLVLCLEMLIINSIRDIIYDQLQSIPSVCMHTSNTQIHVDKDGTKTSLAKMVRVWVHCFRPLNAIDSK